ncbi:helix-turn-helix domain-containing protein [Sphingopyxis sp. EG6]|uniref:helix-turn-helix domain-containing protein n=1 Tax=Sphingopyxis sp. EG6 TaxID=1874061 RepID=UPI0015590354|nr:helix-turn-helix domain-containing protein [Sphingopyxis sp. EG6]
MSRRSATWRGITVATALEDIRCPTEWTFEQDRHVLVIHTEGRMTSLETDFDNGPRSDILPEIGGIWLVPAGRRYTALARGNTAGFIEIQLPARLHGSPGTDLRPVIAGTDPFVARAGERLVSLIDAEDDLGQMLAENLAEVLRMHLLHEYALGDMVSEQIALPARFSLREQALLRSFIEDHLSEPLSLELMAALVERSIHNFLTAFRAAFGTTPIQYVIERRLIRVRAMLRGTSMPITEIALATGFASHSHLTATFRKHMGASPTEWRRDRRG